MWAIAARPWDTGSDQHASRQRQPRAQQAGPREEGFERQIGVGEVFERHRG